MVELTNKTKFEQKQKELKCVKDIYTGEKIVDWTKEFEDMCVYLDCPKCEWIPDNEDDIISYSPKKYSYYLSLQSSLPQFEYQVVYQCPNCNTLFKVNVN